MATKKYLSLDEASAELGLSADQIVKLREDGRLRGFADRGTWKFKADDIAEFARSRQADSAPDVPIIDDDDSFLAGTGGDRLSSSSVLGSSSIMTGDITGDDGDPPTVIRGDASGSAIFDDEPLLSSSDSDVRLFLDRDYSKTDSSPDVALHKESDSDVRLIDDQATASPGRGSDSDVQLSGNDDFDTVSDVRLLSDDDVSVTGGSDSDVALVRSGDSGARGGSAIGDSVFDDEDGITLAGDSGIALESIADSGIALDAGPGSHARPGSGIAADSGIGLADSGIIGPGSSAYGSSIVSLSEDSGIALEALNDDSAVGAAPPRRSGSHHDPTEYEMSASSFDDSEFELATGDDMVSGDDTSVILFDDDDSFDVVSAKSGAASGFSGSAVDMGDDFDEFEEAGGSSVVMEDDDMEFEAADDDFDDGFQTGESAADFAAPVQRVVVAPEPEIGALTFVGLTASSIMLAVCGMMMFDLVRSMWGYHDPTVSSWLLESTRSLF